jgi:hypothetical protein
VGEVAAWVQRGEASAKHVLLGGALGQGIVAGYGIQTGLSVVLTTVHHQQYTAVPRHFAWPCGCMALESPACKVPSQQPF